MEELVLHVGAVAPDDVPNVPQPLGDPLAGGDHHEGVL